MTATLALRRRWRGAAALLLTLVAGAASATELVMQEGAVLVAAQGGATMTVVAGKKLERRYSSDGCQLDSHMVARSQRWFGNLGIYDGARSFGFAWQAPKGCKGVSRTVVEEGQIHFDDPAFADAWIRRQQQTYGKIGHVVWNNTGLLMTWNTVRQRAQLNVNVWQICLNGQRPQQLGGANDIAIAVRADGAGPALYACSKVGKDVIDATRLTYEEFWKANDERIAQQHRARVPAPRREPGTPADWPPAMKQLGPASR